MFSEATSSLVFEITILPMCLEETKKATLLPVHAFCRWLPKPWQPHLTAVTVGLWACD